MQARLLRAILMASLATVTLAHGRDMPLASAGQADVYDALRRNCSIAGEDDWKRCQRTAVRPSESFRYVCTEARERERRMCMLQVMEQQNRDIHGPAEPSAQ